ncbi:hypothetical protein TGAM01_v200033 [Trichoderma gamsii]|uniref:Uncharacterized protein n=1 Tax=Trichoderma gamsii TaxID=398673 RepID=A0A2P5A245_9HYPO|nr:hypothetical protein TGAM01_v200033 [Trichoderma gamsii]PON30613.1 hypothetical protein TGAM01_v200033 [Trichoderma gamsii]
MYSLLPPNRPQYASRYSGNTALETSASQPHKDRLHPQRPLSSALERFPQRACLAQAPATAIEHSAATGPAHSVHCAEPVAHPPPNDQPAVKVSSEKRGETTGAPAVVVALVAWSSSVVSAGAAKLAVVVSSGLKPLSWRPRPTRYPIPRGRAGSHAAGRYWRPSRPRPGFLMVNEWNGARRSLTHIQAAARIARPLFS